MGLLPCKGAGSPMEPTPTRPEMSSGDRKRSTPRRFRPQRLGFFALLGALFLFTAACSQGIQSTWDPVGPVAEKQLQLSLFTSCSGPWCSSSAAYIVIRYRRRPGQPRPPQIHGHTALEVTWTIIPTALILGLGIWSVFTLFELNNPPRPREILEVTVVGPPVVLRVRDPDADGSGKRISTANDLRIPVDRPINLTESDDVLAQLLGAEAGRKGGRGAHPQRIDCG